MFLEGFKRAARRAALFVVWVAVAMPVYLLDVTAAHAKMRVDRLTIEPAQGGAAKSLDVELAISDQEKALGLMFRTELKDGEGMLFPYGVNREITMWMHNTYIPLDMVFIKADGTIHRIESRAEPLSDRVISSGGDVSAVLELAAGATDRLGIKAGDKVRHPLIGGTSLPQVTP